MESSNHPVCDLGAFRCPDATIHMRRALHEFAQNGTASFTLVSIEPSLPRSIEAILSQGDLPLQLESTDTRPITDEDREQWAAHFDEEDHEDCTQIRVFHFKSTATTNCGTL